MKGFTLDSNGDVVIQNKEIEMVNGAELTQQTIKSVLGTNKGEWFLDDEEGINFSNLLGKKKDDDIIKSEIQDGISQVDETLTIDEFYCEENTHNRTLSVDFTAKNSQEEVVEMQNVWG